MRSQQEWAKDRMRLVPTDRLWVIGWAPGAAPWAQDAARGELQRRGFDPYSQREIDLGLNR